MIIQKSIEYEIEKHFYMHKREKAEIENLRREIAEDITPSIDGVGGGSGVSDPTTAKAMRIERETKTLRSWIKVVEETYAHYSNDERFAMKARFIDLYYGEGYSAPEVQRQLSLSTSAFYAWRQDILIYAAIKASALNLITV